MPMTRALSISFALIIILISAAPSKAEDLKEIATQSSQGHHGAAMERINSHIKAHPNDVQALFMRAVMLAEQNRKDDAIKAFTEMTDKFPALPEPYNNLAVLYADQGQFDKAKKALESAIKTHPSYATAHENLGDIYAKMATDAYGKALQIDKTNTSAQSKLALIKDLFSATNKPLQMASTKPTSTPSATPIKTESSSTAKATISNDGDDKNTQGANSEASQIMNAVNQWANAWASKDVKAYLASYAPSFKTPNGETRDAWESMRKSRINKPQAISVTITNISVQMIDGTHAKARFKQDYRSGSLSAKTPKTLDLVKSGQDWLIEQERSGR